MEKVKFLFHKYLYHIIIGFSGLILGSLSTYVVYEFIFPKPCNTDQINVSKEESEQILGESVEDCSLLVDIEGGVIKPGVYCLPQNSVVMDAIKKAGGFNTKTYAKAYISSQINLAKKLSVNEKIYIPNQSEMVCQSMSYVLSQNMESKDGVGKCINLNSGSKTELMTISGVGDSLATKIIEARPFKTLSDLNNVSGIGDSMYSKLIDKLCL